MTGAALGSRSWRGARVAVEVLRRSLSDRLSTAGLLKVIGVGVAIVLLCVVGAGAGDAGTVAALRQRATELVDVFGRLRRASSQLDEADQRGECPHAWCRSGRTRRWPVENLRPRRWSSTAFCMALDRTIAPMRWMRDPGGRSGSISARCLPTFVPAAAA